MDPDANALAPETIPDEPTAPDGAWLCPARGPYPAGAPLVRSMPGGADADPPTPYDEDEFVSLWHQIYRIFLRLGYLKKEDVVFPPENTGRHADINQARLRTEFNMSDRVVSLLERLPYPAKGAGGYDGVMFAPFGMVFNYLHPDKHILQTCRDPHYQNQLSNGREDPSPDYLYPDDVALLTPFESDGMCWILDTKTSQFGPPTRRNSLPLSSPPSIPPLLSPDPSLGILEKKIK